MTGRPELAVAAGVGGGLVKGVLGSAGKVTVLTPGVTLKLCVTGVAAT